MGLISEYVEVKLGSINIKHFEELGYEIPRKLNKHGNITIPVGSTIKVLTKDLKRNSNKIIHAICDKCGESLEIPGRLWSKIRGENLSSRQIFSDT